MPKPNIVTNNSDNIDSKFEFYHEKNFIFKKNLLIELEHQNSLDEEDWEDFGWKRETERD